MYSILLCEGANIYLIFFRVHLGYLYVFNTFKFLGKATRNIPESQSTYRMVSEV